MLFLFVQAAELLRAYLGDFVEGLDTESLNIRVWKGKNATIQSVGPNMKNI